MCSSVVNTPHIQRHWVAEAKQLVEKGVGASHAAVALGVMEAQGGHTLPKREPAPGEQARLHGVLRRKERHQVP